MDTIVKSPKGQKNKKEYQFVKRRKKYNQVDDHNEVVFGSLSSHLHPVHHLWIKKQKICDNRKLANTLQTNLNVTFSKN